MELGHRLGIGSDTIDSTFVKYQNDLTEATRQILRIWLHRQQSLKDARVKLGRALVDCRKKLNGKNNSKLSTMMQKLYQLNALISEMTDEAKYKIRFLQITICASFEDEIMLSL